MSYSEFLVEFSHVDICPFFVERFQISFSLLICYWSVSVSSQFTVGQLHISRNLSISSSYLIYWCIIVHNKPFMILSVSEASVAVSFLSLLILFVLLILRLTKNLSILFISSKNISCPLQTCGQVQRPPPTCCLSSEHLLFLQGCCIEFLWECAELQFLIHFN